MWIIVLQAALAQEIPEGEELPDGFEELHEQTPAPTWEPTLQASVGLGFGAAVHVRAALEPAPLLSAEVGVALPAWGGRLRPLALVSFTSPAHTGAGEDPRLPAAYSYTLKQRELMLGAGLGVRALRGDAPVNPELILAPQLYVMSTQLTTKAAGDSLGTTNERSTQAGWMAAPGLIVGVGPGELALRVALTSARLSGEITGEASALSVSPAIGYRLNVGGE